MLWRVRTTMSDRPGSLAALAAHCGDQAVNILGLQIFPDVAGVTDELVLRAPDGWQVADVATLVESAGGLHVTVSTCTEHSLVDGPTRYLQAVSRLVAAPADLPEILARLLDAEPVKAVEEVTPGPDVIELAVGDQVVAVRRTAAFTATEHARASALGELAGELAELRAGATSRPLPASGPTPARGDTPSIRVGTVDDVPALMRMHLRCSSDSVYRRFSAPLPILNERLAARMLNGPGGALVAVMGEDVVGLATMVEGGAGTGTGTVAGTDATVEVAVLVEDAWQRRGVGTRLLATASRMARARGASDVVIRSRSDNPALLPLVFASGLRGRIKLSGDTVVVTAGVEGLRPLEVVRPQAGAGSTPWEQSPA